jgi:elongator complex protein 3
VNEETLHITQHCYQTGAGPEHFLAVETQEGYLVGFLRLLLPRPGRPGDGPEELADSALIREVHVYGRALHIGAASSGEAQHLGIGGWLIASARKVARDAGFRRMAVIAAIGTRNYYRRQGFELGDSYMHTSLSC